MRSPSFAVDDPAVEEQKQKEINDDEGDPPDAAGIFAKATGATAHPAPFAFTAPPAFVTPTSAPPPVRLQ